MNLAVIRNNFERYGAAAGVHDIAKKALNRVVPTRLFRVLCLVRDEVDPSYFELPVGFRSAFLEEDELVEHGRDRRLDLAPGFVRARLSDGHRCFGITKQGRLVSYGWYASRPTPIDDELSFHFDPSYVYQYKGYTVPEARGQRLHAIGMARALAELTDSGLRGMLAYVESNNFASLRSCFRLGYEPIGALLLVTLSGQTVTFATPGCRHYGVDVRPAGARWRANC